MSEPTAILSLLLKIFEWLAPRFFRPKPELIHEIRWHEPEGFPFQAKVALLIRNKGRKEARNAVVDLSIFKPEGTYIRDRLSFNEEIGSVNSYGVPDLFASSQSGSESCCFRLKPDVFVNPGPDFSLEIANFVVAAFPDTTVKDLHWEIGWKITQPGLPVVSDDIVIDGFYLRRQLRENLRKSRSDR
jgi:hypothetical protein